MDRYGRSEPLGGKVWARTIVVPVLADCRITAGFRAGSIISSKAMGDASSRGQGPRFQGVKTLCKGPSGLVQLAIDREHEDRLVAIKYILR